MTEKEPIARDITRTILAVLFIAILISASFWILRPFLTSIVWAAIIVVATWPVLLKVQAVFRGRRGFAVTVMTVVLLMVIFVPLIVGIMAIVGKIEDVSSRIKTLSAVTIPPPPEWVGNIPLGGRKLAQRWQEYAALSQEELVGQITPYAQEALRWFVAKAGSIAGMILQFLLTVIIAAVMYAKGETAAAGVRKFARRLAGERGEEAVVLAAKACRSVALGIVVTAIVQSGVGGIGLVVTGVPAAPVLTAIMFMLCMAQLGPILVLAPSVIWVYSSGQALWGTVLLIVTIFAALLDNFLRPILIKKGADLPLLLIFAGVIGGLIAFGVIGLFIGPVVLAVTLTLLQKWVSDGEQHKRVSSDRE
ncbi:MAG: AI-2E family transporter YdiK [Thermodesulfovibrionales bacterium]